MRYVARVICVQYHPSMIPPLAHILLIESTNSDSGEQQSVSLILGMDGVESSWIFEIGTAVKLHRPVPARVKNSNLASIVVTM